MGCVDSKEQHEYVPNDKNIKQLEEAYNVAAGIELKGNSVLELFTELDRNDKMLKPIKMIDLTVANQKMSDIEVAKIGNLIRKKNTLIKLKLDLENCSIGDDEIKPLLIEIIPQQKSLRLLKLNLKDNKLGNTFLETLNRLFENLGENLVSLDIDISGNQLNASNLPYFLESLNHLKNLQELNLSFLNLKQDDLDRIFRKVISIKTISRLRLNLDNNKIESANFCNVNFEQMTSIQNFQLSIRKNDLDNVILEILLVKLPQIPRLQTLVLCVADNNISKDQQLQFIDNVKQHKIMQTKDCVQIDDQILFKRSMIV